MNFTKSLLICIAISAFFVSCQEAKEKSTPVVKTPVAKKAVEAVSEMEQLENDIDYAKFGVDEESIAKIGALEIGSIAPDFKSTDQFGNVINLSSLYKDKQVVIVFYRGYWCGYCSKYLESYIDQLQTIKEKGAIVIAVAPEGDMGRKASIEKTGLEVPFLVDSSNEIQRKFGVSFKVNEMYQEKFKGFKKKDLTEVNGQEEAHLPIPATYVIDKGGKVKWVHFDPDYSKRATVAEVVAQL